MIVSTLPTPRRRALVVLAAVVAVPLVAAPAQVLDAITALLSEVAPPN